MSTFDKLTNSQRVRAALHRDVRGICSESCHFLGLEISKQAMDIISELVYKKLALYGTDLEAFCKHAKRTTINAEDVKLLVRRNPSLLTHLNATAPVNAVATKRRKTAVKPQETPSKPKEDASKNKEEANKAPVTKELEKVEDKLLEEFAEDRMLVDDTIDLTFD